MKDKIIKEWGITGEEIENIINNENKIEEGIEGIDKQMKEIRELIYIILEKEQTIEIRNKVNDIRNMKKKHSKN